MSFVFLILSSPALCLFCWQITAILDALLLRSTLAGVPLTLVWREKRLKPKRSLRKKNLASPRTCSVTEQHAAVAVDTAYSYFSQSSSFPLQLHDGPGAGCSVGTIHSSSCWLHCLKWEKCSLFWGIYCAFSRYVLYPQSIGHGPKRHP